jgi:hypothetical protein
VPRVDAVAQWACEWIRESIGALGIMLPGEARNGVWILLTSPVEVYDRGVLANARGIKEVGNGIL